MYKHLPPSYKTYITLEGTVVVDTKYCFFDPFKSSFIRNDVKMIMCEMGPSTAEHVPFVPKSLVFGKGQAGKFTSLTACKELGAQPVYISLLSLILAHANFCWNCLAMECQWLLGMTPAFCTLTPIWQGLGPFYCSRKWGVCSHTAHICCQVDPPAMGDWHIAGG